MRCQKRRNPAGPSRRVSPYAVTSTGPEVHQGGAGARVPSSHQQSDKACARPWFEPGANPAEMLTCGDFRNWKCVGVG